MPAYAGVSILCGLALASFEAALRTSQRPIRWTIAVNGLCLIQFLALAFNPTDRLPTPLDQAAGSQLVARIASLEGDVFIPCHGYLAVMAGKRYFVHQMKLTDIAGDPEQSEAVNLAIRANFERHRFSAVLPCFARGPLERDGLSDYYTKQEDLFLFADPRFRTNAGFSVRPEAIYVPTLK